MLSGTGFVIWLEIWAGGGMLSGISRSLEIESGFDKISDTMAFSASPEACCQGPYPGV